MSEKKKKKAPTKIADGRLRKVQISNPEAVARLIADAPASFDTAAGLATKIIRKHYADIDAAKATA